MQRRYRCGWLALGALVLLTGCGTEAREKASQRHMVASAPMADAGQLNQLATHVQDYDETSRPPAKTETVSADSVGSTGATSSTAPTLTLASMTETQPDRYLIKDATMTVETADVRKAADQMTAAAKAAQGYVANSHESVDGLGLRSITIEVRVPFTHFDSSVQEIETLGKVLDKQVNAQDVTEEFVDTQARLRNLKQTESRLLEHLTKTGKLSDTLLVETELTRVRQEIEELEGKVRFMAHRIAYSTLNLTFKEAAHAQPITPPDSYSLGQVSSEAARSLIGCLQSLASAGIWLSIWGVLWVPAVLLVWYLYRRQKARHSASQVRTS